MSSPESEIDLKRKRRLESVEEKPNLKLLKLDSAEVDAANYKECTKLFDNPEDVVQGWCFSLFFFGHFLDLSWLEVLILEQLPWIFYYPEQTIWKLVVSHV